MTALFIFASGENPAYTMHCIETPSASVVTGLQRGRI